MFIIVRVCLTLVESTISSTNRINSTPGGNRSDSVSLFLIYFFCSLLCILRMLRKIGTSGETDKILGTGSLVNTDRIGKD